MTQQWLGARPVTSKPMYRPPRASLAQVGGQAHDRGPDGLVIDSSNSAARSFFYQNGGTILNQVGTESDIDSEQKAVRPAGP